MFLPQLLSIHKYPCTIICARNIGYGIALHSFAHAHAPLPEFLALAPAPVPLALPSMAPAPVFPYPVVQWGSVAEVLDDTAPVLALCPSVLAMPFSVFIPDVSVHHWLSATLPLVAAPGASESLIIPVSPVVTPVATKTRQSTKTSANRKATDKTPPKRATETAAAQ
jgi:hypothetical protein